jgi:hypothetical protein
VLLPALPRADAAAPPRASARGEGPRRGGRAGLRVVLAFAAGTTVSAVWAMLDQFTLPLRAAGEFGLARAGIARLSMTMQIADIVMLPPLGVMADRVAKSRLLGLVALAIASGTLLMAFGGLTTVRVGCVLVGMGMAGWTLPLGVLRHETAPAGIAWRTALYRVGVDGGIFLGPFLSGLIGRAHLGALPAMAAVVLAAIGLTLLGSPRGVPASVARARARLTARARPS